MKKRIGIIGGGAAGLFAACQLKRLSGGSDIKVTLIEKNPVPGKKLILTGHGRCNITNRKEINVSITHLLQGSSLITEDRS